MTLKFYIFSHQSFCYFLTLIFKCFAIVLRFNFSKSIKNLFQIVTMAPCVHLTYFGVMGKGETIRLVLAAGKVGALLTEHSSFELGFIGTNAHRVDSYTFNLTLYTA